ncbi:hypothetical protein GUJ93_ZPchr0001g31243 [Zizania palustris]|uniref:Pentatricopeptide repeat-containing protein n=1 Tax=Zizania palustris TaxID=103762 RepID=A0A8J5RM31_ZIZPA|nr:hypothetical protein GUJ93_ZPchr0001g31243 [Zizania palustris]
MAPSALLVRLVSGYTAVGRLRTFHADHLHAAGLRVYAALIARFERPRPALAFFLFALASSFSRRALRTSPHVVSALLTVCAGLPPIHVGQLHASAAKCGDMVALRKAFDEMPHRGVPSWNALVVGYARNGIFLAALRVFSELVAQGQQVPLDQCNVMDCHDPALQQRGHGGHQAIDLVETILEKGIKPGHISLVTVLPSCSHSGFVEEGLKYFNLMTQVHRIMPWSEHYACMIDMFGRAGLCEAKQLIDQMPVKPDASVLGALVTPSLNCGDLELGKKVAKKLFEIEPSSSGNYVLLANIFPSHIHTEDWRQASNEVKRWMTYQQIMKEKGCSLVNIENKINGFLDVSEIALSKTASASEKTSGDVQTIELGKSVDKFDIMLGRAEHNEYMLMYTVG